jgi:hypothetical protein
MTHLSKNSLDAKTESLLIEQMTEVLGRISQQQASGFVFEFLGREEKIMLAKRLAAITMIHEGGTTYSIGRTLHISPTTVGKLFERYDRGEFKSTISALTKNKIDYKQFVEMLDAILTVGGIMPRRNSPIRIKL